MRIAVIGAGNGGQAISGYLAIQGHEVVLYDINQSKVDELNQLGGIELVGKLHGFGKLSCVTTNIEKALKNAELVMITTVANAHRSVAKSMARYIEEGQVIILNPGRTCGALVFRQTLEECSVGKRYYLAEAQTLVYACRIIENGKVNVIGVKDDVLLAGLPASDTDHVLDVVRPLYPCFVKTENVLRTSLENIGAIFHPCICLFNAANIERHNQFWFYRDMTSQVAGFIKKFDQERLAVGVAYGIELLSVTDWISFAYKDTKGETLCDRIRNNPAYHDIKAPGSIFTRQLTEDIPTGVLPISELGKAAGVKTPLLDAMIVIIENLLDMDLHTDARSLKNLGLENKSKEEIINYIENGI